MQAFRNNLIDIFVNSVIDEPTKSKALISGEHCTDATSWISEVGVHKV
jgi:hypothetical protein